MTTWLTVATAADYAVVSSDTIRVALKAGDIPSYTFGKGREIRIDAEDVDAWLKSQPWEPKASA